MQNFRTLGLPLLGESNQIRGKKEREEEEKLHFACNALGKRTHQKQKVTCWGEKRNKKHGVKYLKRIPLCV